ncbi:MAG: hypothetical protein OXH99_25245 [Bryobacterales bacterium]|nr:hypothetical protein [Bryobacterales bacterium]
MGKTRQIHPISQAIVRITDDDPISAFASTRASVLKWMSPRAGQPLPRSAWEGGTFTLNEPGAQLTEGVAIEDQHDHYWAARLDDADKKIAQRVWTTEVLMWLDELKGEILFDTRLLCSSPEKDPNIIPSIPGCVSQVIANHKAFLDKQEISIDPKLIDTRSNVSDLVYFLTDSTREGTVFLFGLPNYIPSNRTVLSSAKNVAKRLAGIAHIAMITENMIPVLTQDIGSQFSLSRGSVRTYYARFNPEHDENFSQPLATENWIHQRNSRKPWSFENLLVSKTLGRSVRSPTWHSLPRFADVRRVFAANQRKKNRALATEREEKLMASESKRRTRYESRMILLRQERDDLKQARMDLEQNVRDLKNEVEEYKVLLQISGSETEKAQDRFRQFRSQFFALQSRISSLSEKLEEYRYTPEIPDTLDNFEKWCERYSSGSLVILSRAIREVKNSQYHRPQLIYEALLLLRDYYIPMRQGNESNSQNSFAEESRRLKIECAKSFSSDRWGEEGNQYIVKYSGENKLLNMHLKKGTSREPRYCFRLYFFWDHESSQVIVGWLPSHLRTRNT